MAKNLRDVLKLGLVAGLATFAFMLFWTPFHGATLLLVTTLWAYPAATTLVGITWPRMFRFEPRWERLWATAALLLGWAFAIPINARRFSGCQELECVIPTAQASTMLPMLVFVLPLLDGSLRLGNHLRNHVHGPAAPASHQGLSKGARRSAFLVAFLFAAFGVVLIFMTSADLADYLDAGLDFTALVTITLVILPFVVAVALLLNGIRMARARPRTVPRL